MIPVSNAFLEAAEALYRDVDMRLVLSLSGTGAISYGLEQPKDQVSSDTLDTVTAACLQAGTGFSAASWTRLGGQPGDNRAWRLGESALAPYDDGYFAQYGYWGRDISDASGRFPERGFLDAGLRLVFGSPITVEGLRFIFDPLAGQSATQLDIYWWHESGATDYTRVDVTAGADMAYQHIQTVRTVTALYIVPVAWSASGEPFRICGLSVELSDLIIGRHLLSEVKIVDALEQPDKRLTCGSSMLSATIRQDTGAIPDGYRRVGAAIAAEYSVSLPGAAREWITAGRFYVDSWTSKMGDRHVKLEAVDALTALGREHVSTNQYLLSGSPMDIAADLRRFVGGKGSFRLPWLLTAEGYQWQGDRWIGGGLSAKRPWRDEIYLFVMALGAYVCPNRVGAALQVIFAPNIYTAPVWEIKQSHLLQHGESVKVRKGYGNIKLSTSYVDSAEVTYSDSSGTAGNLSVKLPYVRELYAFVRSGLRSILLGDRALYELNTYGNPALEVGDVVLYRREDGSTVKGLLLQTDQTYSGGLKIKYTIMEVK